MDSSWLWKVKGGVKARQGNTSKDEMGFMDTHHMVLEIGESTHLEHSIPHHCHDHTGRP